MGGGSVLFKQNSPFLSPLNKRLRQVKGLRKPSGFTHVVSKLPLSLSKHCITQLQMHDGGLGLMRDHDYVTYGSGLMQ